MTPDHLACQAGDSVAQRDLSALSAHDLDLRRAPEVWLGVLLSGSATCIPATRRWRPSCPSGGRARAPAGTGSGRALAGNHQPARSMRSGTSGCGRWRPGGKARSRNGSFSVNSASSQRDLMDEEYARRSRASACRRADGGGQAEAAHGARAYPEMAIWIRAS